MQSTYSDSRQNPVHEWWRKINVTFVPGQTDSLLEGAVSHLLDQFQRWGHNIQPAPQEDTDVILTTVPFGNAIGWREALLFTARRRFNLSHAPVVFTLLHVSRDQFRDLLDRLSRILKKEPPDPGDYDFPGLAPDAYKTIFEQGRRGGSILALVRIVQTQAKSIRSILLIGEDQPEEAYTFDLVGAHPKTIAEDSDRFYEDLMLRIVTAASTKEVTNHEVIDEPVPQEVWKTLSTPHAMSVAGRELGKRAFFTEMVRVANLAQVPAVHEAVSSQYSEGCFATWEPELGCLVATVTGSARPVEKDNLTDDELALICGVRPGGIGALVRQVDGKRNDPPSSEAVELMELDEPLPRIWIQGKGGHTYEVPVARSKLHGHRGVKAYDPQFVEHVFLDAPYYQYPVSCSTEAQARAIRSAFSRSEALNDPDDPRQVIFTVLPGHGIVIVEKWAPGKVPFQLMWEYMDEGRLQIENLVPQGSLRFVSGEDGMMILQTGDMALQEDPIE